MTDNPQALFESGRYSDVVALLQRVPFQSLPVDHRNFLTNSLIRSTDYARAVELLEEVPSSELSPELRFCLTEAMFKQGLYQHTVELIERYPFDQPLEARKMLAHSLFALARYDEVISLIVHDFTQEFSGELPSDVQLIYARALFELGRFSDSHEVTIERLRLMHLSVAALLDGSPSIELTPVTALIVAKSMYALRRFTEAAAQFDNIPLGDLSDESRDMYAETLFELERFGDIPRVTRTSNSIRAKLLAAQIKLLMGDEKSAVPLFEEVLEVDVSRRRPHHNYSSRDPSDYQPIELDFAAGGDGILYDQYNTLGERLIHVGSGHLSTEVYAGALEAQKRLRRRLPKPSEPLNDLLRSLEIDYSTLKILPPAWTTQIGHLGLTDVLFRMREFGWWQGQAVILARDGAIGNVPLLSLFEASAPVLIAGVNVATEVWNELFSLQRYLGLPFNSWEMPDGTVVNWSDAGAMLMQQWDAERRNDPMRELYDQRYGADPAVISAWEGMRSDWGMKPNDWHVCLHLRDASFHQDRTHEHRNADFANYVDAIRYITDQGGWVVRVGAANAFQLPVMPRLIDYTSHPFRSPVTDLHAIRTARYFIGTMSGLTNVAISLGIPAALVNCTTYESQVWNSRVRFALKTSVTAEGKKLSQREITSAPWRWRVFDLAVMNRYQLTLRDNSSDEILETVKEIAALADGLVPPEDDLLAAWRRCLHLPYSYGNARPSHYFLENRGPDFLA